MLDLVIGQTHVLSLYHPRRNHDHLDHHHHKHDYYAGPSLHSAVITVFGLTPYLNTFPGGIIIILHNHHQHYHYHMHMHEIILDSFLSDLNRKQGI